MADSKDNVAKWLDTVHKLENSEEELWYWAFRDFLNLKLSLDVYILDNWWIGTPNVYIQTCLGRFKKKIDKKS